MNGSSVSTAVALERCDRFVARTMNWLYDHLRHLPRYKPVVLCEHLQNRGEFPELEAWFLDPKNLQRRVWRRLMGSRPYPNDLWRIRKLRPVILHSHFGYVANADLELRRRLAIPWVVSFYGADVYEISRLEEGQELYRNVFAEADQVLVLGPVMAERVEKLGCPRRKIQIHPLGVDVASLPSRPRLLDRKGPLEVLFAGTFREKKGIQYALEGAALARERGVPLRFHLVAGTMGKSGEDRTRSAVLELVHRMRLEEVVTHYPLLPFQDLLDVALRSHIFIAPSVEAEDGDAEGTPFVLQQMMTTGMPAIATLHSDIPYLFGQHKHLLLRERDSLSIADRLQFYWEKPEAIAEHGRILRERILEAFDTRRCSLRLSEIYDRVQQASAPVDKSVG